MIKTNGLSKTDRPEPWRSTLKTIAPFGTWESIVTPKVASGSTLSFAEVSADGSDILWIESRPSDAGRSALVRRDKTGKISDVTPLGADVGSRVHEYGGGAYSAAGGIVVYSDRTDNVVQIVAPDGRISTINDTPGLRHADFRFLPGNKTFVCVREDHRDNAQGQPEASIVVFRADGQPDGGKVLVTGPDFLSSPRPSPDGTSLAWVSWNHPDMPWDSSTVHVASLKSDLTLGSEETVAGGPEESAQHPLWSPEGILYFSTDRGGWWNIYRQVNGIVEAIHPIEAEIGGPHWVFGDRYFDFLADGRIVALAITDGIPSAVIFDSHGVVSLGISGLGTCPAVTTGGLAFINTGSARLPSVSMAVSSSNGFTVTDIRESAVSVMEPDDISIAVSFHFKAPDGTPVQAFRYAPVNARFEGMPGEKPPLVVMIHGGPTALASADLSTDIQWWTSRGFAVVDVNYRGSTGFGRAFRQSLTGKWGVCDVEDCIAVASEMARSGLADPERMAIRGGSAGGFTALAALSSSDVFRAGASFYGIGDLALLAGETHKFEARYLDSLVGPYPAEAETYAARSPINHIDAISAGIIFFQGLEDKVVPPSQASYMVEAMAARGLPVSHYEFADEGHEFRKPETISATLELETSFYGNMFGFKPHGLTVEVFIREGNLVPGL